MMKKWIIQAILSLIGCLCFCCICSEPCEDTSMLTWVLWELTWMGLLFLDIKAFYYCQKKGLIDINDDDE